MISPTLVVLADDLTGALDSTSPFAQKGLDVAVCTRVDGPSQLRVDILGVNTRSRHLDAPAAAEATRAALALVPPQVRLFKKVDSRLQGNPGPEIRAILRRQDFRRVLILPAVPDQNRHVRNGHVEGHGVTRPIDIRARLGELDLPVDIPDCISDDDMKLSIEQVSLRSDTLLVGARGLAVAWARAMATTQVDLPAVRMPMPALIAVGSVDPITLGQVRHLLDRMPFTAWEDAPDGVVPSSVDNPAGIGIVQCVAASGSFGSVLDRRFAMGIAERVRRQRLEGLLLTGGETATAILDALGVMRLRPLGEVAPGLPASEAVLDSGQVLTIVTKSGGFGRVSTLSDIVGDSAN